MGETAGPMLLGFDVLWVATILSGVAAFAVMVAIYAATTVSDPMAKRVKALNDRREQLKAGITASTKRRAKLVQRHDAADRMRGWLSSMKVLQDSQVKAVQVKLMQAGIRSKEWAPAVIFGRLVLPIVFGGLVAFVVYGLDYFPEWGAMISVARTYMPNWWWYALFPGLFIYLTVLGFNLFGDGLRDVLDPKSGRG